MGLFSNLRKGQTTPAAELTAKAVLTPAVLTMIIDGSVDNTELSQLANACHFSPIFAQFGGERIAEMLNEVMTDLNTRGDTVINEAIAQLSPGLRETALAMAMRVALADGTLAPNEQSALVQLSQDLGISKNNTEVMFHVIGILHRGPDA